MNLIRGLRGLLGISQEDVARACGRTRSWFCKVERGRLIPSRSQIITISEVLGVDSDLLLDRLGIII
jgi:transcriptional regulator with XRE-family HTH domain